MLSKGFWFFARLRYFVVRNQRFATTCLSHLQGLWLIQKKGLDELDTLRMGQKSSPETSVSYRKITMPDKKQKTKSL
jgi:hypothetical protein